MTYIVLSRILSKFLYNWNIFTQARKCSHNAHISIVVKNLMKNFIRDSVVWLYSPLQGFYQVLMKDSCFFLFQNTLMFQKFESQTIWFELYRLFRKQWSILIKSTNTKLRSRLNMVWTKLFFQSFYLSKLFFATRNIFEKF